MAIVRVRDLRSNLTRHFVVVVLAVSVVLVIGPVIQ